MLLRWHYTCFQVSVIYIREFFNDLGHWRVLWLRLGTHPAVQIANFWSLAEVTSPVFHAQLTELWKLAALFDIFRITLNFLAFSQWSTAGRHWFDSLWNQQLSPYREIQIKFDETLHRTQAIFDDRICFANYIIILFQWDYIAIRE